MVHARLGESVRAIVDPACGTDATVSRQISRSTEMGSADDRAPALARSTARRTPWASVAQLLPAMRWRWRWFWRRRKTLARLRRVSHTRVGCLLERPPKHEPFFLVCRTYDISETMCAMVRGLAHNYPNCVGFSIGFQGGADMLMKVHRTARHLGLPMFLRCYRGSRDG